MLREMEAVKQELQVDRESRQVLDTEVAKHFQQVGSAVQQEVEARAKERQEAQGAIASVQASVDLERSERNALQAKMDSQIAELGANLAQEHSAILRDLESTKSSLGEAREALRAEGLRREQGLEAAARHIQDSAVAAEEKMNQHQAQLHERLDKLDDLEGLVIDLTDKERAKREIGMAEMARAVEDFKIKINSHVSQQSELEDRLNKAIKDAADVSDKARSALGEKLDRQASKADAFSASLEAERQARGSDLESARKHRDTVREDVEQTKREFKELCAALTASEAGKREEHMLEVNRIHKAHGEEQREWASMLIEGLRKDLRGEHEANISECRRRGEEIACEAAERVRTDVMAQVSRIESSTAELLRAQDATLREDRARRESEAQQTATEVRDCLTSHSDFMEALEHEQQILIKRLNEGLSSEDQKCEGLDYRIHAMEFDMQKVKGHLPILFAVPGCFR